jgi:hypothetical protein
MAAVPTQHLRDRAGVPVAVLPQVEARQVEAEDLGLPHQGRQASGGQPLRAVRGEATLQEAEVRQQLVRAGIGAGADAVVGPPRPAARLQCRPQLAVDVQQLLSVGLPAVALLGPLRLFPERGRRLGAGSRRAPRPPRAARSC